MYKSAITEIDDMYFDDIDYHGIVYWFHDAEEYIKEVRQSMGVK